MCSGSGKCRVTLRATLDEDRRSRDQWIQAILMVESFKLVPRPLDKGPRLKSGKLRLNLRGTFLEEKSIGLDPKAVLKGEILIWRTKNQARNQRYSATQGFNLLQISPNWFLGHWTLDPCLKWAFTYFCKGLIYIYISQIHITVTELLQVNFYMKKHVHQILFLKRNPKK